MCWYILSWIPTIGSNEIPSFFFIYLPFYYFIFLFLVNLLSFYPRVIDLALLLLLFLQSLCFLPVGVLYHNVVSCFVLFCGHHLKLCIILLCWMQSDSIHEYSIEESPSNAFFSFFSLFVSSFSLKWLRLFLKILFLLFLLLLSPWFTASNSTNMKDFFPSLSFTPLSSGFSWFLSSFSQLNSESSLIVVLNLSLCFIFIPSRIPRYRLVFFRVSFEEQ